MNGGKYSTVKYYSNYGEFEFLSGEHLTREFAKGNHWEHASISKTIPLLQKDWTVISVGTHVGCTIIPLSNHVDRIFCFEGQKLIYQLLLKNIYNNNVTNMIPFNAIMSESANKFATMEKVPDCVYNNDTGYNYGGVRIGKGDHKVRVYAMDDFLFLDRVDLIILDAEGSEDFIIKSGLNLIEKFKPLIIMEINACVPTKDMKEVLGINYNFNKITELRKRGYQGPFHVADENYIFLPPETYKVDDIERNYVSGDKEIKIRIIGHLCYIDKTEYSVYYISKDVILLLAISNGRPHIFVGQINEKGTINWCNNTVWKFVEPRIVELD